MDARPTKPLGEDATALAAPNPYEAPAEGPPASRPSVARFVGFRLAALASAIVSLLLVVGALGALISGDLSITSLIFHGGLVVIAIRGTVVLWERAALTPDQAEILDAHHARSELVRICASRDLSAVPSVDPGDYLARSDEELLQILEHIDPERAGNRYAQLISAIRRRLDGPGP